MNSADDLIIDYVELRNAADGDVAEGLQERRWDDLRDILLQHHEVTEKKSTQAIIPARFKEDENEWALTESDNPTPRNDQNVEAITLAVFDLDAPGARESAEELFKDHEYVLYSTFSYSKEKPYKFRIVLPLEEPIPGEEWPSVFDSAKLAINADSHCGNLSRMYFVASHPPGLNIPTVARHNAGTALSKDSLVDLSNEHIKAHNIQAKSPTIKDFSYSQEAKNTSHIIKHFTGSEIRRNELNFRDIDNSYEGILQRSKSIIERHFGDEKEHSRHYFALSFWDKEFRDNGERTDIRSGMQFIFRAAQEYSSPITHGNTASEMPQIIGSAVMRNAPNLIDNKFSGSRKELSNYIKSEINLAIDSESTGEWKFSDTADKNESKLSGYTYSEFKQRHISALRDYFNTSNDLGGDVVSLTSRIINKDADINGSNTNLLKVSEMIHKAAHGYYRVSAPVPSDQFSDAIKNIKNVIMDKADSLYNEKLGLEKDKFNDTLEGSMSMAQYIALNDKWTITDNTTNRPSISR